MLFYGQSLGVCGLRIIESDDLTSSLSVVRIGTANRISINSQPAFVNKSRLVWFL